MIAPGGNGIIRQCAHLNAVWGLYRAFLHRYAGTLYVSPTAFYIMALKLVQSYGATIAQVVQAATDEHPALGDFIHNRLEAYLPVADIVGCPGITPVSDTYRLCEHHWRIQKHIFGADPFAEVINTIAARNPPAIGLDCEFGPYSDRANRGTARHDWVGISLPGEIFLIYCPLDVDFIAFFSWLFTYTNVTVCVFNGHDDLINVNVPPGRLFDAAAGHGQGYGLHQCAMDRLGIYIDKSFTHNDWTTSRLGVHATGYLAVDCMVPLFVWHIEHTNVRLSQFQYPQLDGVPHW